MIGPVMVGPSSSHTAGAVRLGLVARQILGCAPTDARIELHGSFAETGRGHGTDRAIVAGLLGFDPSNEHIRDSFTHARDQGLNFTMSTVDLGDDVHPNTVRISLRGEAQEIHMVGSSVGGGMVEITEVQGYPVSFTGEYDTLIVIAPDQPGTINTITGWLANQAINVAYLKVGRQQRGGEAIMTIETDEPIPDRIVAKIYRLAWVNWVRKIGRLGE